MMRQVKSLTRRKKIGVFPYFYRNEQPKRYTEQLLCPNIRHFVARQSATFLIPFKYFTLTSTCQCKPAKQLVYLPFFYSGLTRPFFLTVYPGEQYGIGIV